MSFNNFDRDKEDINKQCIIYCLAYIAVSHQVHTTELKLQRSIWVNSCQKCKNKPTSLTFYIMVVSFMSFNVWLSPSVCNKVGETGLLLLLPQMPKMDFYWSKSFEKCEVNLVTQVQKVLGFWQMLDLLHIISVHVSLKFLLYWNRYVFLQVRVHNYLSVLPM